MTYLNRYIPLLLLLIGCISMTGCMQKPDEYMDANFEVYGNTTCHSLAAVFDPATATKLTVPITGQGISEYMITRIQNLMGDARQDIFETIGTDPGWQNIVSSMMVMAIVFFSMAILFGITQANGYVVFIFLTKLILVWQLSTNFALFDELIIQNFEALVGGLTSSVASIFSAGMDFSSSGSNSMFEAMDTMLSMLFNERFIKTAIAVITTGWAGMIYFVLLVFLMASYIFAIFKALKVFIVAIIARSLLYAVAPLFLAFALFSQTKTMFDGWLEQIINFSIQPIFLFIFLGMFHVTIMGFIVTIINTTGEEVCYREIVDMSALGTSIFGYGIQNMYGQYIEGPEAELPFNIWSIISVFVLCYLMGKMCDWVLQLSSRLSSGYVNLGGTAMPGLDGRDGLIGASKEMIFGGGKAIGKTLTGGGNAPPVRETRRSTPS